MIRNLITTVLFLLLSTAAFAEPPCTIVTLGSADHDYPPGEASPPNNDKNLSLIARLGCDGTVTGRLTDAWVSPNNVVLHANLDCLVVEGNDAWMSGYITKATPTTIGDFAGTPVSIRVRDNGTTANDPPDKASFVFLFENAIDCTEKPDYELFDLHGQVQIGEY
jgi:hypothetical protein